MRAKLFFGVMVSCMVAITWAQQASAHVLIANERDTMGAVLHITPDDDPIAGKSAHIFYDIQDNSFDSGEYEATLSVYDTVTTEEEEVKMEVDGTYIRGEYTFATQGVYRLTLDVGKGDQAERFEVTQRVSRGTPALASAERVRHQWAELFFVLSGVGLVVLAFVVSTHISRILKQSQ